ncbi:MAG: toll/interleukin-1 receptor domain-containing protein [Clostridiales bacterium]|nr:toll/interleukin-1 receptor domain-containing protein [Clostridiales bacterium]
MGTEFEYDAFISYRHCSPDKEIAESLHRKLEGYRLPHGVAKKIGKSKIGRIFRDETELAVSDSLSGEIEKALWNSEYLIAICSPEYLESVWCQKEIETFLQYSDRKHILLVLANGEPDEAFPETILYQDAIRTFDDGSRMLVRIKKEPLAADCRADNDKDRNALIEKARDRVAAGLLGIGYDELQRRQRKAKNLRRTRRTLAAFAVLLVILGICVFFLIKISRQNAIISQKYADTLAATSTNLLSDGRRIDAVYAARSALSEKRTDEYSDAATRALAKALGIYTFPDEFLSDKDILLPFSASYSLKLSPNGRYASMIGLDHKQYVVDIESGEVVFSDEIETGAGTAFDGENGFVFKRKDGVFHYLDLSDLSEKDLGISGVELCYNCFDTGYAFKDNYGVYFYSGTDHLYSFIFSDFALDTENSYDIRFLYGSGTDELFMVYVDYLYSETYLFEIDAAHQSASRVDFAGSGIVWNIATDGNTIVWAQTIENETHIYSQNISTLSEIKESTSSFVYLDGIAVNGDDVVIYNESIVSLLDGDLNLKAEYQVNDHLVQCAVDGDEIMFRDNNGGIYVIKNGECTDLSFKGIDNSYLNLISYHNRTIYFAKTGENHITTYKCRSSDYLTPYSGDCKVIAYRPLDDSEVQGFQDGVLEKNSDLDLDRIYASILCENAELGIIQLWDGEVRIYDSETFEHVKTIYSIESFVCFFYYDEDSDYYYIASGRISVYDKDFKNIYDIEDCYFLGTDKETGKPVIGRNKNYVESRYLLTSVTYEELIELADRRLEGYEPDQRVKEKYSLYSGDTLDS